MPSGKRHHVVSRGYLRFFADGETLLLCDKIQSANSLRVRPVGTADVFVRKHFSSVLVEGRYDDVLESEWHRLETAALPKIRSWIHGREQSQSADSFSSRDEAKVLASIHFARSYAFRLVLGQLSEGEIRRAKKDLPKSPKVIRAWTEQYGREPLEGEIEQAVNERLDEEFGPNGPFAIERMAYTHNRALQMLKHLYVQKVSPVSNSFQFILGDSPLVYYSRDELRVGGRSGLALGDAGRIFLPLAPNLAVMFTHKPTDDVVVDPWQVQLLNNLSWRAAIAQVVCHPETDPVEAIAGHPLRGHSDRALVTSRSGGVEHS